MRVLGIDPGTAIVGYSIIDYENGKYTTLDYGCIFTDYKIMEAYRYGYWKFILF